MARLVLGPLLRYVGETDAVIWVETDEPCEVEVLGARARTFCICGHHYALVCAGDLEPGTWHEYEVTLDGERVWPLEDSEFPPSAFRTYPIDGPHEVAFGSCRVAAPHTPPFSLRKDEDERGREIDALYTLARRMRDEPRERWPDALLMLGDQVYADEVSPATLAFVESRRDPDEGPGRRVLDYEEYTWLYRESWSDPTIRWLLLHRADGDDLRRPRRARRLEHLLVLARGDARNEWWHEHVIGALMSYWVYQHLGNLSPAAQEEDPVLPRVRDSEDGQQILRAYVEGADRESASSRWSYCRDLGRTRVIVIDSRAGRVLDEGKRDMVDERGVGLDRGAGERRLRPPPARHLAALPARPGDAGARGLERGGGGRRLGGRLGERRRAPAPLGRPRALGRLPALLPQDGRAAAGGRLGGVRRGPGDDRHAVRRRPSRLPVRDRLPARGGRQERGLPGRVLALPQPARRARAEDHPLRHVAPVPRSSRGRSRARRG